MTKLSDDLLKGADEAAAFLGITPRAVYNLVYSEAVPFIRKGKSLYFRKSELEKSFVSEPVAAQPKPTRRVKAKAEAPPEGSVTLAQMLPLFAELFDPEPARSTALLGRLKNLIKIGAWKFHVSAGKGRTAYFTDAEVRRLLIVMEFCHLGISPEKAIKLAREHDAAFFGATGVVTIKVGPRASGIQVDAGALRERCREHLPTLFAYATRPTCKIIAPHVAEAMDADVIEFRRGIAAPEA